MSSAVDPLSIEHARNDFSESKRWWVRGLLGQVVLVLAAAAGALISVPWIGVATGLMALIGTALLYACKKRADEAYERGEAIRRRTLLIHGLSLSPVPLDVARLRSESSHHPSSDPKPQGAYYNTNLDPGPRRLAHAVWESAHFTGQQAKRFAEHCGLAAVLGLGLVMVLFYLVLSASALGTSSDTAWIAQNGGRLAAAGGALLALFGLGTLGDLWRNFRSLAVAAEQACIRCSALVANKATSIEDALPIVEDYNCAVSRAAPIPSYIWRSMQKPLSDTWEVVQAQTKT